MQIQLLMLSIIMFLLSWLTTVVQANQEQEDQPIFNNVQDRTFKNNQKTTDSKIYAPGSPFSQASFIPDISVILDSSYLYRDVPNSVFRGLHIPAFTELREFTSNGLNLNYAELTMASTVDPYFDLLTVIPVTPDGIELEEAFINTRNLPLNLQLKMGKFRSSWGRLNSHHEHLWDFADPPLVYTAIFGGEQLNETGLQLNWLVPIDAYLLLGAELFKGDNTNSFGTTGFTRGNQTIAETNLPNLVVGFAKTSFDIGDLSILGGLSYAQGGTKQADETTGFDGLSQILGIDLTLKYFISSYTYLSLQSEYMFRHTSGNQYQGDQIAEVLKNQSGLYSQLVWRFDQQWRTGIRYDLIPQNDVFETGVNSNSSGNLVRYSAMLEYDPTEFSRIRLQYSHDRSLFANNLQPVNQVVLQLNMAIGAHGAHAF